jgi:hypothetical protein
VLVPDANVLLYAVNSSVPQHITALTWLDDALSGSQAVGLAWVGLLAFLRISTRPGILPNPLPVDDALDVVDGWLAAPPAVVLQPGRQHLGILRTLLAGSGTGGNLTSDAHLAALAVEHGAELWSFDRDFARFPGLAFRHLG